MKILMLDCDGVINHHGVYAECAKRPGQTKSEDWVDPVCVALVNDICDRTGAVIVVSSSWRDYLNGWEGVRDVLAKRGLTAAVVGHTPTTAEKVKMGWYNGNRWDEIDYWLTWHPEVTHWVVWKDALVEGIPPENLVRTTLAEGLTREGAERAVSILTGV